jgi:hypothetical protein
MIGGPADPCFLAVARGLYTEADLRRSNLGNVDDVDLVGIGAVETRNRSTSPRYLRMTASRVFERMLLEWKTTDPPRRRPVLHWALTNRPFISIYQVVPVGDAGWQQNAIAALYQLH